MAWWNKNKYPVDQIQKWIADGKTQAWIGEQLQVDAKLIYKVCKKHGIRCQRTGPRSGPGHPDWKGGRIVDKDGYVLLYCLGHPYARQPRGKYVLEHRLVMESHLGRYLDPKEVVHHKNKEKADNRIENLGLYSSNGQHLKDELTGHVPNWTEAGKLRIQQAVAKAAEIRQQLKAHETSSK